MIPPAFAAISRLLLRTGRVGLLAGLIAAAVEIPHLL
jgi:hypothetical protein